MPERKILLTSTHTAPYILDDVALLRKHFPVEHLLMRGLRSLVTLLRQVRSADVTLTWFASLHACMVVAVARWFRKPSIVVVAGADVNVLPGSTYGATRTVWRRALVGWTLRRATVVLPVHGTLRKQVQAIGRYRGENIRVIPTGYECTYWVPGPSKELLVLAVAAVENEARMKVKGIDLLFEAARLLPEFSFQIVGLQSPLVEQLWDQHPPNVELIPYITRKDLLPYFQQAKVYCQPSRSEGLPNSLCEAMLCECVPVGADVGAIRTVIGDAGFVFPPNDIEALTMALQDAMTATPEFARRARQRIARTYPLEDREVKLVSLVHDLIP